MFFAYTVTTTLEDYYSDQKAAELTNQGNKIAGSIRKSSYMTNEGKRPLINQEIYDKSEIGGYRIFIFDVKSVVIFDSNDSEGGKTYIIPEVIEALNKKDVASVQQNKQVMYAAVTVLDDNGEVAGAVLLVSSMAAVNDLVGEMTQKFVILAMLLGLITSVLVFFVSQLIIDPLRNILRVVKKMSEGHLNQRIHITSHDEFAELSANFNDMADKLETVETSRQEFVSNVSHELKTPLSSMKVLGESILLQEDVPNEMYREFLQDIISEVDRMTNIINELLTLVKLDRTEQALNIGQVKVNKMIEDMIKRLTPLAEQKKITLLYEDIRTVDIDADEMKLSLAISNVIENGIKYTQEGGTVKVIVDADHANAFITVADNGIGISDEDQNKVFIRFYRVDKTRDRETGGTGLGLSITHKTVLMHNGSIKLSSKENEGSTFVIRLPIHQN